MGLELIVIGGLIVVLLVIMAFASNVEGKLLRANVELAECKEELKEYGSLFTDDREEITIVDAKGKKRAYEIRPVIGKPQIIDYRGDKGPKGMYEIRQITQR